MSTNKIKRAKSFEATRHQHKLEMAQDYTELVHDLIEAKGVARTCDIAEQLGVSHVTALRTIQRLQRDGFLFTSPHRPVELTEQGKKLAKDSKVRHELLLSFLLALGVPQKIAEQDVEGLEHHISEISLKAIRTHLNKIKK